MKKILGEIFTLKECNKIIKLLENMDWKHVRNQPYIDEPMIANYYLLDYPENDFVKDKFRKLIHSNFPFKLKNINVYVIKYTVGQFFGRHNDRNKNSENTKDYVFNINVLLNDDFEGGEFFLDDIKFEGNLPGIAYTYNSSQYHEVKPVKSGIRYAILCYIRERDIISKETNSFI